MKRLASVLLTALIIGQIVPAEQVEARGGRGGGFRGGFGGRHGFGNHYDNLGRWGRDGFGGFGDFGPWGGWGRPLNRFGRYGYGGYAEPYYGGAGYGYDRGDQSIDQEGNYYPNVNYNVGALNLGVYAGQSASDVVSAEIKSKPAIEPVRMKSVATKSAYKLGPDTDILENGSIAVRLNDDSFLLIDSKQTLVVNQKSGVPTMALYSDPLLLWNISTELQRQSLGLKASVMNKLAALKNSPIVVPSDSSKSASTSTASDSTKDKSQSTSSNTSDSASKTAANKSGLEIENMEWVLDLMDTAQKKLGAVPDQSPVQAKEPVPDSVELFASVWLLKDGSLILYKQPDGSIVYMNSKGTFSDRGKTSRSAAYPDTFELAVYGFLKSLIGEYQPTLSKLNEDKDDTEWALSKLGQINDSSGVDELESERRLAQAVSRSERRLNVLNSQINLMPGEVDAAKKALAMLDKT